MRQQYNLSPQTYAIKMLQDYTPPKGSNHKAQTVKNNDKGNKGDKGNQYDDGSTKSISTPFR
jgi:hypothetical protein